MVQKANPSPAPGPAAYPQYNPGQVSVPGQGQTAVTDPASASTDPSVLAVSTTSQKYYGTPVPGSGTRRLAESIPGAGAIGQRYETTADKTLGQLKSDLYDLGTSDTSALADLQVQLIKAGLLDPSAKNFGLGSVTPDDPTDKAYTRLLTEAIDKKGDYNVILNSLANNPDNSRGSAYFNKFQQIQAAQARAAMGGGTTTSQTFDLTDPNYARLLVNQSLENHLGRKATPEEVGQFYQGLHAAQLSTPGRETDTYGAGGSPFIPKSRVSYSTRPEPAAAADAFAMSDQGRANEAGAQSEVGFMSVLQRLLGVNQQGG